MNINSFFWNNQILIEGLFAVILIFLFSGIIKRTKKLYNFSKYKPINLFSNAFLLYGISVLIRFFRIIILHYFGDSHYLKYIHIFEQYLLLVGGFMFLFSMLWKKINKIPNYKKNLVHLLCIMLSISSVFFDTFFFTYFPLTILFAFMTKSSFQNYKKNSNKTAKLFFKIMLSNLLIWISFTVAWIFLKFYPKQIEGIIYLTSYIITTIMIGILFFAINKITKDF